MSSDAQPSAAPAPTEVWGPPEDPLRQSVARPYRRMKRRLKLARSLGGFFLLAAFVASGAASWLQRMVEPWASSGPSAVVALYVAALALAAEFVSLPLDYYSGFALEHRFGLSNQSLKGWLADEAKGFSLNLALTLVAAEILFWLLRTQPSTWWIWAAAFFIAVAVVLTNLAPVLIMPMFFKFEPLEEEALKERLLEICRRADTRVRGVFRWGLSAKTKAANAALVGWGNTRRVLLADTLIESFEPGEVVGVFAHELGHHVHGHIWRGMALQSFLTVVFFAILGLAAEPMSRLQGLASPAEAAMLPSMLLVTFLFSGALFPLLCAWSRRHEWQADSYAIDTGGEPEAYARALERLCALNLAELDPPGWVQFLFGTHPAPGERIRAARAGLVSA